MPQRLAIRLTEEILSVMSQLTGETIELGDNVIYLVIEPISNLEFNMKLMDEESMVEAFRNDSNLHIVQFP